MKLSKRLATVLVTLFALLNVGVPAMAAEGYTNGELVEILFLTQQEDAQNEIEETLQAQTVLIDAYSTIEASMKIQTLSDDLSSQYVPDYAGAYIDGGKLIVCVTSSEAIPDLVQNENVEYRIVENSYNLLYSTKASVSNAVREYASQYKGTGTAEEVLINSFAGIGIDEEFNKLIVDIVMLDDDKIETFYQLFGENELFVFQNVGGRQEPQATYKPGVALYVLTKREGTTLSYSRLSMGFRAYKETSSGNKYGFVTAAHGAQNSIDDLIYTSNNCNVSIGTITDYIRGGSVDASFIERGSNVTVGTTTHYSDEDGSTTNGDAIVANTYMTSVPKGSTVVKVGSTTYRTTATVQSTSYDTTFTDGVSLTNLTKTTKFCDGGDSGGLVYMYYNGGYKPAGIITGSYEGAIFSHSSYTKATAIVEQMGVYPY